MIDCQGKMTKCNKTNNKFQFAATEVDTQTETRTETMTEIS